MRSPRRPIEQPRIDVIPAIAARSIAPATRFELEADDYDRELEYELSAVVDDQDRDRRLRHELIYVSPNLDAPIDLSEDHDIWHQTRVTNGQHAIR